MCSNIQAVGVVTCFAQCSKKQGGGGGGEGVVSKLLRTFSITKTCILVQKKEKSKFKSRTCGCLKMCQITSQSIQISKIFWESRSCGP